MITLDRLAAAIVTPESTIFDAVKAIEDGGIQAVLVASANRVLAGVITDGDVRRSILRGVSLDAPVSSIMNSKPAVVRMPASRDQALDVINRHHVRQVPVLDADNRIIGAFHVDMLNEIKSSDSRNWAVIMAGGRGTRLHPLTESTPKPMIPIGGKPLIETIVRTLIDQGFSRIYLSVNYMADVFKAHFGDGSRFGAEIKYIEETTRLGTAGALGFMEVRPPGPLLVMNGDLLTSVNYNSLLRFHTEHKALATMCVRDYSIQIPYGVIDIESGRVTAITEKPIKTFFVNAGIYVLDPSLIGRISSGEYLDMTQLLDAMIEAGEPVYSFPIHEYWLDIGKFNDLERAQEEFHRVFGL